MSYVLKIKKGEHAGKYVGRKGIRSWDWKPQSDINNARVFSNIGGIKSFFGVVYRKDDYEKCVHEINSIRPNFKDREKWKKERAKIEAKYRVDYTDRYEAVEISINNI